ncbi:hypothetical protein TWF506_001213 [Arthrobotrys conoides]|uniref:Uncharacterized protein n=1 Tax=Arthrobotrys conoides TaxID=74498 RepID=A0AAN8PRQ1_9PEZI
MTTNISKIQAALASVTQETTLALFNLNLDCSLIKVDAPAEYLPFGNALTKRRRTQAEAGPSHRNARKLGMLFEGIVPQTPELVKAYGIRATEIIEFHEKRLSSKSSGKSDYGPFTEYVGVDGTSIWAAATSSGAAIAVHLLACLLAVAFTAEEAVAIWEQIVEARKEEISNSEAGDLYGLKTLAASTWDISRQDLANWDASARAWIRSANTAKELQCYQLRLILDNIDLPVHTSIDAYRSVIETWQTCLKMMDALVQGNGQDIQNGGLFVAFRAWHIFPDLILLKNQKYIKQNDPLVRQGGVVTIGLERAGGQNTSGVNWSLSLSHLQFYGNAERREGYLNSTKERVSIPNVWEFLLGFCLGAFFTNTSHVERKIKIATAISDLLLSCMKEMFPGGFSRTQSQDGVIETSWVYRLNQVSKRYSRCTDEERKRFRQLMALGHKSYRTLCEPDMSFILQTTLGDIATHIGRHHKNRFSNVLEKLLGGIRYPSIKVVYGGDCLSNTWEIRSVQIGTALHPTKLNFHHFKHDDPYITVCDITETPRLVKGLRTPSQAQQDVLETALGRFKFYIVDTIDQLTCQDDPYKVLYIVLYNTFYRRLPSNRLPYKSTLGLSREPPLGGLFNVSPNLQNPLEISDIEMLLHEGLIDGKFIMQQLAKCLPLSKKQRLFRYLLDMSAISGLYEKFDTPLIDLSHLATCFLDRYPNVRDQEVLVSYLPTQRQVHDALFPKQMTQSEAFQWIHYLESRGQRIDDIHPLLIAISSEDSLFVASQFLQDPSLSITNPLGIIRLPGNIGRPGVILLVAPKSPRHPNYENTLLEDAPFDGQLIDCFRDTTLHLTLTGYELPLELRGAKSGARHHETWVFEATTSVHVAGKWIGDISPLETPYFYKKDDGDDWENCSWVDSGASKKPHRYHTSFEDSNHMDPISREVKSHVERIIGLIKSQKPDELSTQKCPDCQKSTEKNYKSFVQTQEGIHVDLTSIDCWEEYFHRPSNPTVFRARSNWVARLAAVCFSKEIKAPIIPIHPQACKCRIEWLLRHPNPSPYGPDRYKEWIRVVEGIVGVRLPEAVRPSPPMPSSQNKPRRLEYHPIYLL